MSVSETPEQPSVLNNPNWKTNRIASSAGSLYKFFLFFGIAWNSIIAVVVFFMWDSLADTLSESPILYIFVIFPLVGVLVLYLALKHFAAWKKFGSTPFIMEPFPAKVGGKLGGYVDLSVPYDPTLVANVVVSCFHNIYVESTSSDSTGEYEIEAIWESDLSVNLTTSSIGSRIQFEFDIPDNLPVSELESENFHHWAVQLNLPLKGMDYLRTFEIPVVK